jgi:uncharacterized protein (TIGR00266 family)
MSEAREMGGPRWLVNNSGSFASVNIVLPSHSSVDCESDAVVTFSQGIQVKGMMSGGFLSSLARVFLTNESFFTTQVQNTSSRSADVLLAPADPGGIVLHQVRGAGDDLLLSSGAYVASDSSVTVTSEFQRGVGNSLLSGTGFFLLRASGRGTVACAAYGSVHQYVLREGEERAVDNGHLVAWSTSCTYRTGLANSGSGGILNSMTSGEGLMCFFQGPGTIYLQSHKPEREANTAINGTKRKVKTSASLGAIGVGCFITVVLPLMLFLFAWLFWIAASEGNIEWTQPYQSDPYTTRRHRQRPQQVGGRVNNQGYGEEF